MWGMGKERRWQRQKRKAASKEILYLLALNQKHKLSFLHTRPRAVLNENHNATGLEPGPGECECPAVSFFPWALGMTQKDQGTESPGRGKQNREGGKEDSRQKEKGRTFFDAGVVPQLIAPRALTPQVARGQDSAGYALWTPAAPVAFSPGQAQQAAWLGHTGVASCREGTGDGTTLTHQGAAKGGLGPVQQASMYRHHSAKLGERKVTWHMLGYLLCPPPVLRALRKAPDL